MGLDEAFGKMWHPGAGIVLIGMHRFVFTHHRCCRRLSGAEQGWPARLSNGQIYQLHALCLSLSAFRPDNWEHILAILAQSRSAHGRYLLTDREWLWRERQVTLAELVSEGRVVFPPPSEGGPSPG